MIRGYIQIYTGNGKGKSTAALGVALRAAGAGLKVKIIQFMKSGYTYCEYASLERLKPQITVETFGDDLFVLSKQPPAEADIQQAKSGINRAWEIFELQSYNVLILDEICVAVYFGLLKVEDGLCLIDAKPESLELILTGRYCPMQWIERADLVTEMREVKHYYREGVLSRRGIDS